MRTLWVIIILCFVESVSAQQLGLIPYRKGNLWGYATEDGKVQIKPAFERTYFFSSDSVAKIKLNGLYGYIDSKGEIKLKPQYTAASDFYMGIAQVETARKKFCINLEGNEDECPEEETEEVREPEEQTLFTVEPDSLGFALILNNNGDTIPERYDEINIIQRYFFPRVNFFAIVKKNDLYGLYNEQGTLVAPVAFSKIDVLDADLYKGMKNNLWGVQRFDGTTLLDFTYDSITKVMDVQMEEYYQTKNHFIVSKKNKYGVVNEENKPILKIEYDEILIPEICNCPLEYIVKKNGLYGLANEKGKLILPILFKKIAPFQSSKITIVTLPSGQEGYLHQNGREFFSE